MPRVLVIGDAHVDETQDLRRFAALGKKIRADNPDKVLIIGDFLSMNCLSEWDKNKRRKLENLRYKKEITAGNRALDLIGRVDDYIEGNHEERLSRYLDYDPTMEGMAHVPTDLNLSARSVVWHPYKTVHKIDGVGFTHIPINAMGKTIGNPNVAKKALDLFACSIVFGHTHTLDHAGSHRHGSPHYNQALGVGCFFEHIEEYAKGSKTDYWRGVVELNIYSPNRFDFATTSMSQLLKQYGSKR